MASIDSLATVQLSPNLPIKTCIDLDTQGNMRPMTNDITNNVASAVQPSIHAVDMSMQKYTAKRNTAPRSFNQQRQIPSPNEFTSTINVETSSALS